MVLNEVEPMPSTRVKRPTVLALAASALGLVLGLGLNYELEHRSFGRMGDLLLPVLAFGLLAVAVLSFIVALIGFRQPPAHASGRRYLLITIVGSVLLTAIYAAVTLTGKFADMGDTGDCLGLMRAANAGNQVPQSVVQPGRPAIYCLSASYGVFLLRYDLLHVYGVADHAAQDDVVQNLSRYRESRGARPIRVEFYQKENWITWQSARAKGGSRGPEQLIRIATVR